jgi:hypothetical protein
LIGIVNLTGLWQAGVMKTTTLSYHRHRFPSEVISYAVWLYHRFPYGQKSHAA